MEKETFEKIEMFLAYVNKVTSYHRHGNKIPVSALNKLSDEQLEMENWLKESVKNNDTKTS